MIRLHELGQKEIIRLSINAETNCLRSLSVQTRLLDILTVDLFVCSV